MSDILTVCPGCEQCVKTETLDTIPDDGEVEELEVLRCESCGFVWRMSAHKFYNQEPCHAE